MTVQEDPNNPEDNQDPNLEDPNKNTEEDLKKDNTPESDDTNKEEAIEDDEDKFDLDKIEPEIRSPKKEKQEDKKEPDKDDADGGMDPDDEKAIGKVVKKELETVNEALKGIQVLKDQTEVDSFIRTNPDYSKYRDVALKYLAHPNYANIPVKNIMAIVSANDMQKIGAKKEREAAQKAKETKGGGEQSRPQGGDSKTDWFKMPKEQFEAEKAKILQGGRS